MVFIHLVLKFQFWDLISQGKKTIEYRKNTPFYQKRIISKLKKEEAFVVLHRGYTKQVQVFKVAKVIVAADEIQIHLEKG